MNGGKLLQEDGLPSQTPERCAEEELLMPTVSADERPGVSWLLLGRPCKARTQWGGARADDDPVAIRKYGERPIRGIE